MKYLTKSLIALAVAGVSISVTAQTCLTDMAPVHSEDQYIDNHDGTVLDVINNLLWSKCNVGESYDLTSNDCSGSAMSIASFSDALTVAAGSFNYKIGNYTGFRLPNIKELNSLVDYRCNSPAIDLNLFPTSLSTTYISSTPDAEQLNASVHFEGLVVDFKDGAEIVTHNNIYHAIRLVREFHQPE